MTERRHSERNQTPWINDPLSGLLDNIKAYEVAAFAFQMIDDRGKRGEFFLAKMIGACIEILLMCRRTQMLIERDE